MEFNFHIESIRKEIPLTDQHGNACWWTDVLHITDPRFPVGDPRHEVTRNVNRHRTDTDEIGGSGKWDPGKGAVQIDGIIYTRFRTKRGRKPYCELCEKGDMIPPENRFLDSTYKPPLP